MKNYSKVELRTKVEKLVASITRLYNERGYSVVTYLDVTRSATRMFIPIEKGKRVNELDEFLLNWATDEANKPDAAILKLAYDKGVLETYYDGLNNAPKTEPTGYKDELSGNVEAIQKRADEIRALPEKKAPKATKQKKAKEPKAKEERKQSNFALVASGICPHDNAKLEETAKSPKGIYSTCTKCAHKWYHYRDESTGKQGCVCITCRSAKNKKS